MCARARVQVGACAHVHTLLLMPYITYIYKIANVVHLLTLHPSEHKRQPALWRSRPHSSHLVAPGFPQNGPLVQEDLLLAIDVVGFHLRHAQQVLQLSSK